MYKNKKVGVIGIIITIIILVIIVSASNMNNGKVSFWKIASMELSCQFKPVLRT